MGIYSEKENQELKKTQMEAALKQHRMSKIFNLSLTCLWLRFIGDLLRKSKEIEVQIQKSN